MMARTSATTDPRLAIRPLPCGASGAPRRFDDGLVGASLVYRCGSPQWDE
jgi:hypothetical protein